MSDQSFHDWQKKTIQDRNAERDQNGMASPETEKLYRLATALTPGILAKLEKEEADEKKQAALLQKQAVAIEDERQRRAALAAQDAKTPDDKPTPAAQPPALPNFSPSKQKPAQQQNQPDADRLELARKLGIDPEKLK